MIELDWTGDGACGWSCEYLHFCAWIEMLPIEQRFAWLVQRDGERDVAVTVASGVAIDLHVAGDAVAAVVHGFSAGLKGSWSAREDGNVIDLFPGTGG